MMVREHRLATVMVVDDVQETAMQDTRVLPDPAAEPTITVPRAAAVLGLGLRTAYDAVERGEMPAIRVGRAIRIPTVRFLAAYGFLPSDPLSDGDAVTSNDTPPSHVDVTPRKRPSGRPRGARRRAEDVPASA
jgi:excisionase family DNA binding protein